MLLSSLLLAGSHNLHKEAVDWHNRVLVNGGRVSNSTLKAVSNFCRRIDAAGIRDRFMRLNLFCGNNLNACVVPLYTNTSMNYTHVGNAVDTNNSFVDGDYSASTGLTGDASNKTLETGVDQVDVNTGSDSVADNSHISVYAITKTISQDYMIGSFHSSDQEGFVLQMGDFIWMGLADVGSSQIYSNQTDANQRTGLTVGTTNGTQATGKLYNDNSDLVSWYSKSVGGYDQINICVFGIWDDSQDPAAAYANTSAALGGYSFGNYMTPTQVANYTSAMSAFQTAMGRAAP